MREYWKYRGNITTEGMHGMWGNLKSSKVLSWAIVAGMLVGIIVAARELPQIRLQNKLETWLSEDDDQARALRRMESLFSPEERILVSWDSSSLSDARTSKFRDQLQQTAYISKVRTAADVVEKMTNGKVDPPEAIRRLTGVLIGPTAGPNDVSQPEEPRVSCVLSLSKEGVSNPAAALETIQSAAVNSGIPADELRMDGAIVTSHAIDQEVLKATWNSVDPLQRPPVFAITALAGILLAFVLLRSVLVGLMVTASAWFTAIVTTALIPAAGHTMNMVTIVMPTLLVVLTISGAIHVVNYWRHAASSGSVNPIREAVRMGWWPCLLANATTAVGLVSLAISQLVPIRDFGIFSTIGTLLSFAVVIVGLPAMLRLSNIRPQAEKETHRIWSYVAVRVARHRNAVILSATVIALSTGFGLQWLKTEIKVGRYFPEDARLNRDSRFIEENIAGTSSFDLLVHFSEDYNDNHFFFDRMALIREIQDAVRQHPDITGAISLADFLPVYERPEPGVPRSVRMKYTVRSRRTEEELKTDEAAASAEYLAAARDPDFVWSVESPLDETWRITAQTRITRDLDYAVLSQDLSRILSDKTGNAPGLWFSVTGTVPVFYRAQTALLESLTRSLALAFALIAVALIFLLRSIRAGLLSSIIGILPVTIVFGIMSWSEQVLDIGTMLTGSVALGISVDDMLHLMTWFRGAIRAGNTREQAVVQALQHCGAAMTQTTLVIALSLLLLYPAELLLISRFGWVMAALLGTAWVSSVLLLPALLAGPLGGLIEAIPTGSGPGLSRSPVHPSSCLPKKSSEPDSKLLHPSTP
ncbi:MAG: MMPL family transporter [Planctomycetaceae bacterium]|nr:MMPL family transporter [Planctomycetaceae bacterium]